MKIHTGEKQFTCNICTASFLSHEELRGHRKKEHRLKKTIKCKRCQESFATEGQLEDHKVSHLLSCPFCQKTFKNKTNLQIHINFHNNPPLCDICQRDCKTYGRLKHHKLTHTKDKPYKCKYCPQSYNNGGTLHHHQRNHFSQTTQCDLCEKTFSSSEKMAMHKNYKHGNAQEKVPCPTCFKYYPKGKRLNDHMIIHSGKQPFQ